MNALPLNAGVCTERNDAATKLPSRIGYAVTMAVVVSLCLTAGASRHLRRVGVLTLNTDLACCWRGRFAFTFLAARSEVVVETTNGNVSP